MATNEEKNMAEQSTVGQKRKLTAENSFDDDLVLDGFSELDKLEPIETTSSQQQSQTHPSHNFSSIVPSCSTATSLVQNGAFSNGVSTPASIGHQSHSQQQMHGQQGPNSVGQPQQQQQQSVLQELLLTQSSASTINNSPRPQQQLPYSSNNFPNKSPMPHSLTASASQNMSPMGVNPQRLNMSHQQQIRQSMPAHFDPSMSQSAPMPLGNYLQQGGANQMICPQQFVSYQQHPRPNVYGPTGVRISTACAMPQAGMRPPNFSGNIPQHTSQIQNKGTRPQAPHTGMIMSVPSIPPTQNRSNVNIGPMGIGATNANFDPNNQTYQQVVGLGAMNGTTPSQRQTSLSDTPNGYMMQNQMINSTSQAQPMPSYMCGQIPQHRPPQSSMGFGPTSHQQMASGGPMDIMTPGPSQQSQPISQMPPHSHAGILINGSTQIIPTQRHSEQPSVSIASNQNQTGMMVSQSPAGLMNTMNNNGQQMRVPSGIGTPNQQIMSGQSQDPEKRKLIQQQLVLLLHAHKCQQRGRDPQNRTQCTLPYCDVMKGVLQHMVSCNVGRQCQYPHCASSRQIITHWKNCNKEDCPVCTPLKKNDNQNATAADRRQDGPNFGNFPTQSTCPPLPQSQNHIASESSGPMFGSPSHNTSVNNLLDGYNPNATNPFRSTNPPNKVGSGILQQKDLTQMTGFVSVNEGMPPPEPPSQARDWHASITPDLRNHLVGKLVKAIFPSPDPAAIHDQRIRDLISYARKVEKDMFEAAPDKEAYYHMLAEKIYKIQKELQEKKNRRLNEQQMQQQLQRPIGEQFVQPQLQQPQAQFETQSQQPMQQPPQLLHDVKHEIRQEQQNQQQPMLNFVETIPQKRPKLEEQTAIVPPTAAVEPPTIKQELNVPSSQTTESRRSTTPRDMKPSTSSAPPEPIVRDPKKFDPGELRTHLIPVWKRLLDTDPESIPFRLPVDPLGLKIPDYFDVIKNPMDLQTIKNNLDEGKYADPWEFCDHMWLMFENAWLYNRKNTKIHKWCTRLSEIFIEEINPAMRKLGYCCGQKLSFTPLVQFCFGITKNNAACVIARDQPYYMYESSSSGFGVTVAERYIYCVKCFESLPDTGINLNENTADPPNWITKEMFQKMKNDQIDMEPFEHCQICDRKWHRICALHSGKIVSEGFICSQCRESKSRAKPENKFTAKKLPHCQLSHHIEDRVNNYLRQKLTDNDPEIEVVIRVLSSSDKEVEVKPYMLKKFGLEGYPDRFPYRSKAIFAFEVLKDPDTGTSTEVCFFGLYVQEYGTNCAQPNQRRVYIAYLDSVHFFQPRHLRTSVYYEILLGYLQYVKLLGYTMAHIWACPPSEGDDYIFHCHPPEQKIPKPKRLQDWYKTMLNNGNEEGTVHSYRDIFNQAKDDALDTPMKLPYFEGDYWPRIIDECIASAEKEEEIDRRKVQEEPAAISDDDTFQTDDGLPVKKQQKSTSKKKNNLKKSSQSNKKKGGVNTGNPLVDRLFQQLEKHRDVFFTIRLFSHQDEQLVVEQKPRIEDPDPLISCELMDTRDNFLAKSREEHWEFSQLRRAKWSTLNFCYTLHTQEQDGKGLSYTCNVCEQPASYHCNTCDDYDLCESCKMKVNHPHEMEKSSIVDEQKSTDTSSTSHNDSVRKCINSLVHACQCKDRNCTRNTCLKMKKVINHTKTCKRRVAAGANCAVCKQLIALCCYHAKHCTQTKCNVPFCQQIRLKLQEQKRSQNRQAERMMQRRMMKLHSVGAMNGSNPLVPSSSSQPVQIVPTTPQNWTQPQSPKIQISNQSQFINTNTSQIQQIPASNPNSGMMISTTQQQQIRYNTPVPAYTQIQSSISTQNQIISSSSINVQSQQMSSTPPQHPSGYQIMGGHMGQQQMPTTQMGANQELQRIPSSGEMHVGSQQMMPQPINPPQYIRPGTAQVMSPMSLAGVNQQINQGKFIQQQQQRFHQPSQPRVGMQQDHQQLGAMGISQHHQMRDNDVHLILNRLGKAKSNEEREMIFTDLRKTPHLFNAFLKMTKKEMGGMQPQMRSASIPQQQFTQSPAYQGNTLGMMPSQSQQNGVQFNSPPPHQWMPSPHQQQVTHANAQPPQRNPT